MPYSLGSWAVAHSGPPGGREEALRRSPGAPTGKGCRLALCLRVASTLRRSPTPPQGKAAASAPPTLPDYNQPHAAVALPPPFHEPRILRVGRAA